MATVTSPSPRMGLLIPQPQDQFSTALYQTNFQILDSAPGAYICTSTTRPPIGTASGSWWTAQKGRKIIETDTGLEWMFDGTKFVRLSAVGLLKTSSGGWAIGEKPSDFTTTSQTYVQAVTLSNVVVPAGNRPIRVEVAYNNLKSSDGFVLAIFRSNANNSGPKQVEWGAGTTGQTFAGGGTFFSVERNGLAAGTYNFSVQAKSNSGQQITIAGDATTPITIQAIEM